MKSEKLTQIVEKLALPSLIAGALVCQGVFAVKMHEIFSIHDEMRAEYNTEEPVYINGVNANQPFGSMAHESINVMVKSWEDSLERVVYMRKDKSRCPTCYRQY
jgi:hypothetical protein